jgi:hypothetical protein
LLLQVKKQHAVVVVFGFVYLFVSSIPELEGFVP